MYVEHLSSFLYFRKEHGLSTTPKATRLIYLQNTQLRFNTLDTKQIVPFYRIDWSAHALLIIKPLESADIIMPEKQKNRKNHLKDVVHSTSTS